CDALASLLEGALGDVDLLDASSVEDARVTVKSAHFDVCFVCLDLPPAPLGGVRLAQQMLAQGQPVVLITRSLRWIPELAPELRDLLWVSPEARAGEVAQAVSHAIAETKAGSNPASHRSRLPSEPDLDWEPSPWPEAEVLVPIRSHASRSPRVVAFGR